MRPLRLVYADELYDSSPLFVSTLLGRAIEQHGANMTNRLGGIQTFGTHVDAVLNAVATKHAEGIIEAGQTVFCSRITAVGEESVRLKQTGGTNESIGIPPERGTTGRATGTQNAFIQAIQLRALLRRLQPLDRWRRLRVL